MHPKTHNPSFRVKIKSALKLLAICSIVAFVPVALYVRVASEDSARFSPLKLNLIKESKKQVTVQAAGRGNPYLNVKDGRQMTVSYRGGSTAVSALQTGAAGGRALAAADLDGDGAPDVVAGFANGGTGIVTVQKGNPEGFAPQDDSVFQRMHQGYNPPSLLPTVETYQVLSPVDFLQLGDFNNDGNKDVLIASRDGSLRLLPGDGQGGLGAEQPISLPGNVTSLTAGEFRAADGRIDVAVGLQGFQGPAVLVFDGAAGGFESTPFHFALAARPDAVEFGELDSDPFMDLAIANGPEINIVHGWGRKLEANPETQVERIPLAYGARSIAVDNFTWDRQGTREIAVLAEDGSVRMLEHSRSDKRAFTEAELIKRAAARAKSTNKNADVEVVRGWSTGGQGGWSEVSALPLNAGDRGLLAHGKLSSGETNALMVPNGAQRKLDVIRQVGEQEAEVSAMSAGDVSATSLDVTGTPVAMIELPKKLNGVRDIVVLTEESAEAVFVPIEPNAIFSVNIFTDPAPDGVCNASPGDCSFREAVIAANAGAGPDTINLPAGTYTLTIIGNTNNAGAGEGFSGNAAIGDVDFKDAIEVGPPQSPGTADATTVSGAGAASTFIVQTTANDRVLEPNPTGDLNFDFTISGVTIAGGRDTGGASTGGGGGFLSGSKDNLTTVTDCVFANNRALGAGGTGGGGIQNQGGTVTITNTVFGGPTTVAACPAQTSTNCGNSTDTSGGGIGYSPGDPFGRTPSAGTLTIQTTSSFQNNTANSAVAGGGGGDFYTSNLGTGSVSISGTTFTTNNALGTASGGGMIVESIATTVATSAFNNNTAGNRGGGIQVAGGSLTLNGAVASITFTGNTATTAGSSISTSAAVTLQGTNTTIGGDIEVTTNGSWTNAVGSSMSPNNFLFIGNANFTGNNSTTNVTGNFQFQTGVFNAGTGLFNFNGTTAQTINNSVAITFFNLTDSNVTQPLTTNSINVSNTLNVNGANAIFAPQPTAIIGGTGTLTGTGTARVTRILATADFLTQYTIINKTLTNLQIDYSGAGNQTVNNTPPYSRLRISGSGIKTLQGNTSITSNLDIAAATFNGATFNFSLGGNWTNNATFTAGTGTVTFAGTTGTQLITGNTTFNNLTLNNAGASTDFGITTTTIANDLVATAGTMVPSTSTIVFTGAGDNVGSFSGAAAKSFHNLQINAPATISNATGGNTSILNDYTNNGTFTQAAALTTTFASGPDGIHTLTGAGTNTFGNFTVDAANTVNSASNFNIVGAAFTSNGAFNATSGTATFAVVGSPQAILGDGTKLFSGLTINNSSGVTLNNGAQAVDAAVAGLLTLTTDFTVASGAILQQGGTSAGAADVLGTVRRTDLGVTTRSFGNVNNQVTVNTGTPPTQLDLNLAKVAPPTFPAAVKVVPRHFTLTPVGGAAMSATLRLRYIDPGELTPASITESRLILWKNIAGNWTGQGGTVDTAGNFVTHSGISSFSEWAIAEGSDLTLTKANNVSGSAVVGQAWNWTLTATNTGSPATFTAGQTIISDNLPNTNVVYGTPTVQAVSNITGSGNISCSIVSNDLTCTASGGSVTFDSNIGASSFQVVFSATGQAVGSFQNPRTGGGIAQIDPNNVIAEFNETNNSPANNTVTVGKANTTTTINSDTPDPSVVGQPVTVTWSVTVNAPGSLGAPLTGNVTVSDGTDSCVAAVSAGQCDVTFTSAGAKSLTATYAGDSNYNGSASTPATPHTVNKADTTTTITGDAPDPSTPGQSVLVTWTVTANAPGAGTPTGTVTVTASGGAETCNAPVATGQCSIVLNGTGLRTLTATYGGDTNFNGSSDTEDHQVCGLTVVTSTADSGAGSLRQIIADACEGATITFDIAGTGPHIIGLTTGEIAIAKNLTLNNNGGEGITISGSNLSRVFSIGAGKTVGLVGLTISGGSSANDAGAILNDGALTIVNSTLSGNAAVNDGGAISNSATGSLTLINTTISGNTAADDGGGVNVLGGTVTSINSTITNNTADSDNSTVGTGGGISVQAGTVTLKNTIVAGNFNENGASDSADDISGTVDPTSSFNLVGDAATAGGLTNGANNNQVGVAAGLGALANNGGTTQTHALLSASLAIEAGSNANVPADTFDLDGDLNTAEPLPVDQRGATFPRIADSADVDVDQTVDIGAYEAHPTISDIANQTTNENTVKNVGFNIGDDTGALIASVTATSSNTTLVPNANLLVSGSGGSRNLQITPATNQTGTTTITVTVTATNGRTAIDTFDLSVNDVNAAPAGTDNTVSLDEDTFYTFTTADFGFTDPNDSPPNSFFAVKITTVPSLGTLTNNNVLVNAGDFIPVADINGGLLKFTPVANGFGTPYTSFTFQVQDNGGILNGGVDLDPTPNTMSINVNGINDPPSFTIAGNPPAVPQDAGPQTVLNFATAISAGPNETQVLTFNLTQGVTTGTLTFSTAPAINATTGTLTYTATNGTNGTAEFSVTLSDDGSNTPPNSNTSAAQLFTITVNAPNASPVVTTTGGNLAYTENDPATVIDSGLTVTDADNANLVGATVAITAGFVSAQDTLAFANQLGITGNYDSGTGVLTLTGTTTVVNYQTALRTVTYQNSSDNPTASRTITFSANDGVSVPGTNTRGIAITAVNDAPVNTVPIPQNTNEDTPKVFSSGNGNQISVADVDLGSNPIKITLTATNGTITLSTTAGLTFTPPADGIDDTTMVFTGLLGAVNTALNGLSFTPTLDFTGAASLQIISDDQGFTGTGGAQTDTDLISITVNAVNDAPVVTATAGNLAYLENDPATAIDPGLTVTDADSPNLTGATVAISSGFVSAQDVLGFVNQNGITGNYDNGTGVLTLTGSSSVANYQTALRSVTYQNTSDDPTTSRTITFVVNDGTTTDDATRGITITPVNDAPVNTVPGQQGTNLNTPLTFSPGNGNQVSVADADAGTSTIQVSLTVTNGTLTLSGTSGLSFGFSDGNGTGAGDGSADTTMTFRGTLANVNAAMNGMTYTPDLAFTGAATLTITSSDLGNTGTGGVQTDTDVVNIQVATSISIQNSQVAEPESGTINMVFTVTMSAPAPAGGASVNFTTVELAPALNHATAGDDYTTTSGTINFAQGDQVKTILVPILSDNKKNEANETFEVLLSGAVGATIGNGTATGTILIVNQAGTILISEIRTSGPSGEGDDFVEIYNNSNSAHIVGGSGYGLFKMGANCLATPILIGTIPASTTIPARGHFLFVGSAYSLANYGATGEAAGDATLAQDIDSSGENVAIFNTTSVAALSTLTRLDAVGFGLNTGGVCDLLREGTTLTPLIGTDGALQYSYFRDECGKKGNSSQFGPCPTGGMPKDSNVNNDDFVFVETTGANTAAGQRLGAPGPQNLGSARFANFTIGALLLDATKGSTTSPNRVRDNTPVTNGTEGTLTLRRRFVNTTGAPVTRLRFRIVDISALTFQGGIADLRALTSTDITVSGINDSATCLASNGSATTPCSVTVRGTTLEDPPPQPLGGGLNSSMSAGTITFATPLNPGQSINLQLQLGVMKTGSFKFFFNIEALP